MAFLALHTYVIWSRAGGFTGVYSKVALYLYIHFNFPVMDMLGLGRLPVKNELE
jgi:hypothetical protein